MTPTYDALVKLVGSRRASIYAQVRGLYGRRQLRLVEMAADKGISKQRVFQIVQRVEEHLGAPRA